MKHQPKNGILIKEFHGDSKDQELTRLVPFLKYVNQVIEHYSSCILNQLV